MSNHSVDMLSPCTGLRPASSTGGSALASHMVQCLGTEAESTGVAEVRIGLGYTAVLLDDGRMGVAYTFRDLAQDGCAAFTGLRPLAPRPALDLLVLLESEDALEAGVGLACANALAHHDTWGVLEGDVLEHLVLRSDDHVGMVGNFGPLISTVQKRVHSLTIFERVAEPNGLLRPHHEALQVLPQCQVALITATAIINHTMDGLLEATSACREVVVLGASTPLMPHVFTARGVTMLSGVVARDPRKVLQVISEGGGMRQFSPHIRKVTLITGHPRLES